MRGFECIRHPALGGGVDADRGFFGRAHIDGVPLRIELGGEPGRLAPAHTRLREMASPPGQLRGMIEIEVSGARIRVEPGVDPTTLSTVLSALRGGR